MHTGTHDRVKSVEKLWMVSFFSFYLYQFLLLLLDSFFEFPSAYDVSLWAIPFIHYFAFKRSNAYWFTFFTGFIVPVGLIDGAVTIFFYCKGMVSFLFFSMSSVSAIFFIVMSFKLLRTYAYRKRSEYYDAVRYTWLFTLLIYDGLFEVVKVQNYIERFQVLSDYEWGRVIGMVTAPLLFVYISYYFSVQRNSNVALFITLLCIPKHFMTDGGLANKIALFGFFLAFCFSSYRLYRVNKSEAKAFDENLNPTALQGEI